MDNTNSAQKAAGTIFDNLFDVCPLIDYKHDWVTSGDTFNSYHGAVSGPKAPVLTPGDLVCSVTPLGRRLLILGTELGNAVAFTPYLYSQELISQCYSPALEQYIADTKSQSNLTVDKRFITVQGFSRVFGSTRNQRNIHRIFEAESAKKRAPYLSMHDDV